MYNITVDLNADIVIMVPIEGDSTPLSFTFSRMDVTMPGAALFYKENNILVKAIPWTSISFIDFTDLAGGLKKNNSI